MPKRYGAIAAMVLTLLISGCGVAAETGVTRDQEAPWQGRLSGSADIVQPRSRAQSTKPEDLVANYLRAAAGESKSAADRARAFMLKAAADAWRPGPEVLVVRQIGGLVPIPQADGGFRVDATLQPIGVLTEHGAVNPVERAIISHPFLVYPGQTGQTGQTGFFLSQAYSGILLSSTALALGRDGRAAPGAPLLYRQYLLYFWDQEARTLVPDLRYFSLSTPRQQRPTELVRRLAAGPSGWLGTAVQGLPEGTELRGNVVLEDDRLVVDLNAKVAAARLDQLLAQLRWSLWELHNGPIVLQVEGQERGTDAWPTSYGSANRVASLASPPEAFCVAGGVVLLECTDPVVRPPPSVLGTVDNKGVLAAAFTRRAEAQYAALVVAASGGRRTLRVGQSGTSAAEPQYRDTGLSGASMSRPVWMPDSGGIVQGLVAAGGKLYRFDSNGGSGHLPVTVGGITAVAVAPDARRVAFAASGKAYVATISARAGAITVGVPQILGSALASITAIGWSRPERLVVAGSVAGSRQLVEISVDGMHEAELYAGLGTSDVTQIAAYPDNPTNGSATGLIMIEWAGTAHSVFTNSARPVDWTGPPDPSPTPTPSSLSTPPVKPTITAPFFAD